MSITYNPQTDTFIALSQYDEKDLLKDAGFRWDPVEKRWYTRKSGAAAILIRYADDAAKVVIHQRQSSMK